MSRSKPQESYSSQWIKPYPYHALKILLAKLAPELLASDKMEGLPMKLFQQATQCPCGHKPNYQKLEFIGDSVYLLVVTEYLSQRFSDKDPGFISELKIRLERGDTMASLAKHMDLSEHIRGAPESGLTDKILEDVFEAFTGAFYLTLGFLNTKILIITLIERFVDIASILDNDDNYKGILLRYFHQRKWGDAKYVRVSGNRYQVRDDAGNRYGSPMSHAIPKEAEKLAAKSALQEFGIVDGDQVDRDWLAKMHVDREDSQEDELEERDSPSGTQILPSILNPNNKVLTAKIIRGLLGKIKPERPIRISQYKIAMCHPSYVKRANLSDAEKEAGADCVPMQRKSNRMLRLLGSAVIHCATADFIYASYPESNEGTMTVYRARLEHKDTLAHLARRSGLVEYLLIARDVENNQDGRNREKIVRGCLEAFVGAIYLDQGLGVAYMYICTLITAYTNLDLMEEVNTNYKGILAEKISKNPKLTIRYSVIDESGPAHDKVFVVGLYLNNKLVARGKGSTKKDGQQLAAKKYLAKQDAPRDD